MRTGSPPTSVTAFSYCGIARSAYSGSELCGIGIAMRGAMLFIRWSAHPLDRGKGLVLAVVPDFHHQGEHEDYASRNQRHRNRDVPVGDSHVRMHPSERRNDGDAQDSEQ